MWLDVPFSIEHCRATKNGESKTRRGRWRWAGGGAGSTCNTTAAGACRVAAVSALIVKISLLVSRSYERVVMPPKLRLLPPTRLNSE